jgi:hypothetical protein
VRGARLEQQLGAFHVVHHIDVKVASPAFAHPGLRRQVEDVRDAVEQTGQIRVGERGLDQREGG